MGPWPGDNLDANKDTFNYYQSRTRSRRAAACARAHADVPAHPNPQHGHTRARRALRRITIERSFGILTKRFLVLKRPYGGKLKNVALLVEVCMKLHNLVIDAGELDLAVHSSDVTGQPDNDAGLDSSRTPVLSAAGRRASAAPAE
eukprot:5212705-Prymnesium_polylepis.1